VVPWSFSPPPQRTFNLQTRCCSPHLKTRESLLPTLNFSWIIFPIVTRHLTDLGPRNPFSSPDIYFPPWRNSDTSRNAENLSFSVELLSFYSGRLTEDHFLKDFFFAPSSISLFILFKRVGVTSREIPSSASFFPFSLLGGLTPFNFLLAQFLKVTAAFSLKNAGSLLLFSRVPPPIRLRAQCTGLYLFLARPMDSKPPRGQMQEVFSAYSFSTAFLRLLSLDRLTTYLFFPAGFSPALSTLFLQASFGLFPFPAENPFFESLGRHSASFARELTPPVQF